MSSVTQDPTDNCSADRHSRRWAPVLAFALLGIVAVLVISCTPLRVTGVSAASGTPTAGVHRVVTTATPSAGCGGLAPFAAGSSQVRWLASGGHLRAYLLHIPRGYLPTHEYPLVLSFHGHGSSALHQEHYTGFSRLADAVGFIVAYPQGLVGPDGHTGWASGGPDKPYVNDVVFISNLLWRIQAELCVNPQRIYATGFSNGGGMTSVLACEMSDRIAAFAPVSGSYYTPSGGCHPSHPVPILEFHGTGDLVVPYAGRPWQDELGAMQWLDQWALRDGCAARPLRTPMKDGVTLVAWTGCQDGAAVVHYTLSDGVHVWPMAESPSSATLGSHKSDRSLPVSDTALNATSIIWKFFTEHPLPASPATPTRV